MHLVQALQGAQRHLHGLRLVPGALHGAHELFQEPVRRPAVAGPLVLVAPPLPRLGGVVVRPGGRSRMVILAVAGTFAKPLARLAAKSATSPPTTSMDNDTTAPRPAM